MNHCSIVVVVYIFCTYWRDPRVKVDHWLLWVCCWLLLSPIKLMMYPEKKQKTLCTRSKPLFFMLHFPEKKKFFLPLNCPWEWESFSCLFLSWNLDHKAIVPPPPKKKTTTRRRERERKSWLTNVSLSRYLILKCTTVSRKKRPGNKYYDNYLLLYVFVDVAV